MSKFNSAKTINSNNLKKGFTIVELVMVVVIMAILFTMGTYSYRDYQRRQYLEGAATQVEAALRLTQEMALSGRKPQDPPGNNCLSNNLGGYAFRRERTYSAPSQTAQYAIYAYCPNWSNRVLVKGPVDLPMGIGMASLGPQNAFAFNVLAKGIDRGNHVDVTLSYDGTGIPDVTIRVSEEGTIERQ